MQNLNLLSEQIIGGAIEVHRELGPGLLESLYEKALCFELERRSLSVQNQLEVPVLYKGQRLGVHRLDLLVEYQIVVELKAVDRFDPVHQAQLLGYMKLAHKPLGLLINFNVPVLKDGVKRIVL
ncbi:GxxExxY protein [Desulfuromonas carbonis]